MSSLDREIPISGWRVRWLDRTLPAFQIYANAVSFTLAICICVLGLIGFFGIRTCNKQLKANPLNRQAIFKAINKRVIKTCKGHWFISIVYLINVLVIGSADAIIGVSALKDDVAANPEVMDTQFILDLMMFTVYCLALFATAFVVVPLLQVLLATALLSRFARKRGITSLSEYLPEARMYSTHIAQLWAMAAFFMMAFWRPMSNSSNPYLPVRWLVLEGTIGSALAWMDASFAFNFCYKRLNDENIDIGSAGVRDIVRLFGKTMRTAHSIGEKEALPRYEDATATVDEKTPLTEAQEQRELDG